MAGGSTAVDPISWCLLWLTITTSAVQAGSLSQCPEYVGKHAPLLWLHSDDPYMPSDLLTHINHTTPELDGKPIQDIPSPLNLDNLGVLSDFGEDVALTSNEDPTTFPKWFYGEAPDAAGRIHNSTPCVVILVERSQTDVDAFFFYFYSYNEGPNITQVLEPLTYLVKGSKAATGMSFGNHIGDWEHNMVRFRDGQPTGVYFSQHVGGAGYDWDDDMLSKIDGRPVVYSARGSHANYPASGDQVHDSALVDYCDEGKQWDPILSAYFFQYDPDSSKLSRIAPPGESSTPPPSNLTSFFYFPGRWGDFQYPDADPRQETVPYFGLKRFESGPTGPRAKNLVRKGLVPEGRGVEDWPRWVARMLVKFYPCCLRGWRLWVSLGVVVAMVAGVVIGIVIGVRRHRRRSYRKLQSEDIPLESWREEEALLSSSEDEDRDRRIY